MKKGTIGKATTHIDASPEAVYDLVSDVKRMGEWSPECRHCEWLDGATGPAVGARFKGSNKSGWVQWSTKPKVVIADPGREFAFVIGQRGHDITKWSYRLEPAPDGTVVTESFEMLADVPWYYVLSERYLMRIKDRRANLEKNMAETLERLKSATERQDPPT